MLCVQVDLVVRTIQRKADGALGLAAIDVVDEQGLYLLGHAYSVPLVELCISVDYPQPISLRQPPYSSGDVRRNRRYPPAHLKPLAAQGPGFAPATLRTRLASFPS